MSITLESAARLAALRDKADAVTGESSDTLAVAVDALIAGYGQGSGGGYSWVYDISANWTETFKLMFANLPADFPLSTLPKLQFTKATSLRLFMNFCACIERIDYYIDSPNATDMYQVFMGASNLKYVRGINTKSATMMYEIFKNCSALETIEEPLDFSKNTSNISGALLGCPSLKDISFVAESVTKTINIVNSDKLTDASVQSIIDGLADLTSGTAQTITFHGTVKAKLTDEQIAAITNKNWTLA